MKIERTLCDYPECPGDATIRIVILVGEWEGVDVDACSLNHADGAIEATKDQALAFEASAALTGKETG